MIVVVEEKGIKMNFNERLRELRNKKGISIAKLAELSGVTGVSICYYEQGTRKPNVVKLSKLANALECDYEELYELMCK